MTYHPDAETALAPLWPLFDWPSVRRHKCLTLYTLARRVEHGAIVELGTYHGTGTIALALGARDGFGVPVHTVDPFIKMQGWIGEPYGPDDLDIFRSKIEAAHLELDTDIILHRDKSEDLVRSWQLPIELMFWDIGGSRVASDFHDWNQRIVPGGIFAVKDLASWQFGTGAVASCNTFTAHEQYPQGCIWTFIKQ